MACLGLSVNRVVTQGNAYAETIRHVVGVPFE